MPEVPAVLELFFRSHQAAFEESLHETVRASAPSTNTNRDFVIMRPGEPILRFASDAPEVQVPTEASLGLPSAQFEPPQTVDIELETDQEQPNAE